MLGTIEVLRNLDEGFEGVPLGGVHIIGGRALVGAELGVAYLAGRVGPEERAGIRGQRVVIGAIGHPIT